MAAQTTIPAQPEYMMKLTGDPNQHDISEFSQSMKGRCLCGSVQVVISDLELFSRRRGHICHCSNCRKVSGSYASINLIIEEDRVDIIDRDGTMTEYKDGETMSGNVLGRWFCSRCGNPIKSVNSALKGKVILKMGIFPRIPEPEIETFASHRHEWQGVNPGLVRYKTKIYGEVL